MSLPEERAQPYPASPSAAVGALILLTIPVGLAVAWRPTAVLVGLGVVVFVAASVFRVDLPALTLLAVVPLEGAFAASQNSQLSPTKIVGIVCLGSFLVNAFATRRRLLLDSSHALVLLLLGFAVVSAAQARDTPLATSVTLRYASYIALFVILTQLAQDHRFQRKVVWVMTAASAVSGLLAMRNFVGGEAYLATLPYSDPNENAFFLAATLPLAFWLLADRAPLRPLVLLMIGTMGAAIFLSFSRGALVGLAAGAIWHALTHRRHLPILLAGAAVGLVIAVAFARTNPEQVETGFELKSRVAAENVESRLENWRAASKLAVTHPVGVGPGNFESYYYEATGRPPSPGGTLVVHNTYLEIAAELGLVAMMLFLAYLALTFRRLIAAQREALGPPGIASALTTSLVIAIVAGAFISEQYHAPFWVLGALATAVWAERRAAGDPRR